MIKRFLVILIVVTFFSGCATQRLTITKELLPDKLGIQLVNNANISDDDWIYFTSATDNFIENFNLTNQKFKLYSTNLDSNSLKINIEQNEYVTKDKQILGTLVTLAGIATPILLISGQAPIVVSFWYIPKNTTLISRSLSNDLNIKSTTIPHIIQTRHKFESIEKQKEKQKKAYSFFLNNIINEIEYGKKTSTIINSSNFPDKLILNDGREIKCKLIKEENQILYIKIFNNDRSIDTQIDRGKIKSISRGEN